jgi:hypothetical protein
MRSTHRVLRQLNSLCSVVCGTCPCCRICEVRPSASMSSSLSSIWSSSLDVLSCLLEAMFLSRLSSMLRRHASVVLACLQFLVCSLLEAQLCWALSVQCTTACGGGACSSRAGVALVLVFSVIIIKGPSIQRLSATRCWKWVMGLALLLLGVALLLRVPPSLRRIL